MKRRLLVGLLCALGAAAPALAQTGSITGTVKDSEGGVLPGATVSLSGPATRTAVTGADGSYAFENLPPGAYRVTAQMPQFAPGEQSVNVTAGAAAQAAFSLSLALRGEEVTVSASRVETSVVNAPATVSVLSTDTIASSPAQNYGDLLRTVPGVNVIQMSNRDVNLTSRQATNTLTNSQLALLDGRTIYLDFFGLILWDFVPTNPAEIKQIEVVRGPASAVWGANALTGVVNIITKTPRESQGGSVTLNGGLISRDCDNCSQSDSGTSFGGSFSYAQAPNDTWSWKLSAGYFNSDAYSRPTGQIPVIPDPRVANAQCTVTTNPSTGLQVGSGPNCVGGGVFPADRAGAAPGTGFQNSATSQPKADLRVDQELGNGGHVTYAAGYAATEGIVHTGIGPFDIQSGSNMMYGRANYTKGAFKLGGFYNRVDVDAPNLLNLDPTTLEPIQLNFNTDTFDLEIGHSIVVNSRNVVSFGGNARRNLFDITLAPASEDRTELGAYGQWEFYTDRFRIAAGGRVDKFGNLDDPVFSPRVSVIFKPERSHSIRLSFNKAFRSPSTINNYLNQRIFAPGVAPIDLRPLIPLLRVIAPPLVPLVPAQPVRLTVLTVGNKVGSTSGTTNLKEESLTAYEVGYTGTFGGKTTVQAAFYINDQDDNINFTSVLPSASFPTGIVPPFDVYTPANSAEIGIPGPLYAFLLQARIPGFPLPRTVQTYLNLGPIRNRGVELGIDHAFNREWSAYANYSWQDDPEVQDPASGQIRYPPEEIGLPPTNRFNAGVNWNSKRFLGNLSANYTDKAFWSDVLTPQFFGFTDSFTLVNATFGVKWNDGKLITTLKGTNLLNQDVQQHIFGDILKRSLVAELRYTF
jgi:outer membrane receptor protein involved in Fe transport